MTINELWYLTLFVHGVICACAVIAGLRGR
ncbi:hypothetical protein ABIC83_004950 [Roseateles asaccharophilus]|uniref:Uncharacterized protein n=1 Tax=Roseateles asaccharophilus TaxID=582607 RepID=A0ABU2AAP1_9BURK|nr:hypothetical protein [Roseateles asaccharophilus]